MPKREGGPTPLSKLQDLEAQRTVPQEGAGTLAAPGPGGAPLGPSRQRDRCEGRGRSGRGSRSRDATEGCPPGTFALTVNVNVNVGRSRESPGRCSRLRPPPEGRILARARRPAPSPGPSLPLVCTLVNWVGRSLFLDFFPRLFQKEGLFSSDTSVGLNLVINLQQNTGSLVIFLPGIYVLTNR